MKTTCVSTSNYGTFGDVKHQIGHEAVKLNCDDSMSLSHSPNVVIARIMVLCGWHISDEFMNS